MKNFFLDLKDNFLYDVLNLPLPSVQGVGPHIFQQRFKLVNTEEGGILAESEDYPGLYACGTDLIDLREALYDTILTYFDVPRAVALRSKDTFHLTLDSGVTIKAKSTSPELAHS